MLMNADTNSRIARFLDNRRAHACVSKSWHRSFSENESVWRAAFAADYHISEKVAIKQIQLKDGYSPTVEPCSTFREAWLSWRRWESLFDYKFEDGHVWLRAIRMWDLFEKALSAKWTGNPLPGCRRLPTSFSIRRQMETDPNFRSHLDLKEFEAFRAIWSFTVLVNGPWNSGINLGTATVYSEVFVLSLDFLKFQVLEEKEQLNFSLYRVVWNQKLSIRYRDGAIYSHSQVFPIKTKPDDRYPIMVLFEAIAQDLLENGRFTINGELSLFALRGPTTSVAISQGLRVRGAFRYIHRVLPQRTDRETFGEWLVIYQFIIEYIANPQTENYAWKGKRCQLLTRHWTFYNPEPNVVEGEGVIGLQPYFDENGRHALANPEMDSSWQHKLFYYCSQTTVRDCNPIPSMEGYFTFGVVEDNGRISSTFRVDVGKLTFEKLPYFIC